MFHQFFVPPEERTYMRFFWFKNNNPEEPLVEYWSNVHIMGKRDSPSIANFGLRFAAIRPGTVSPEDWIETDDLLDPTQTNRKRPLDPVEEFIKNNSTLTTR